MGRPDARTLLAFGITLAAILGIIALSLTIVLSTSESANTRAQNVLNTVLPLFGTWVGTVLAYYFSRENFEAGTSSSERLVRQLSPEEKLQAVPVAKVMTRKIISESDLTKKVVDVLKNLQDEGVSRLPILDASSAPVALVFREGIFAYLYEIPEADRPNKTLNDLLSEKPELKRGFAMVNEKATLADAKAAMEKVEDCKVVFVTQTGSQNEPVLGLITNTDIAKHSVA